MRITNTMMMNQTLRNVSKSKNNLNTSENELATEKKITRPSDDPIVAIRALSLRSSLSEINQYLKHNIPDAESWLDVTQSSLNNMDGILSDIFQYCNQGSSDQFTTNDRSAIIDVLKQYRTAIYSEANADYAGRYCFTGYKTDTSFTFLTSAEAEKKYEITETFDATAVTTDNIMKNSVDASNVADINAADYPETRKVYRVRLAYQDCAKALDSGEDLKFSVTDANGTTDYTPTAVSRSEFEKMVSDGTFDNATDSLYYIYDTGEIVMTDDLYDKFSNCDGMSFTYQKDSFNTGDVRPEMYFNCTDITNPNDPVKYTFESDESISYTVNFSQSLQVNTLGRNALSYDIGRDIDDMCNALQSVLDVENKIAKLKSMKESGAYSTDEKKNIDTMITAAEKEYDYALDNMKKTFSKEITNVKGYQQTVSLELADLGARQNRLTLTKDRLSEQYTTFDDLKSKNEDVDLEDVVIKFASAQTLYQAALSAASSCVQKSLLDYI